MNAWVVSIMALAFIFPTTISLGINSSSQLDPLQVNTGQESGSFLYKFLDDFISRINKTLNSNNFDNISNECFDHISLLLLAGKSRESWALKSK